MWLFVAFKVIQIAVFVGWHLAVGDGTFWPYSRDPAVVAAGVLLIGARAGAECQRFPAAWKVGVFYGNHLATPSRGAAGFLSTGSSIHSMSGRSRDLGLLHCDALSGAGLDGRSAARERLLRGGSAPGAGPNHANDAETSVEIIVGLEVAAPRKTPREIARPFPWQRKVDREARHHRDRFGIVRLASGAARLRAIEKWTVRQARFTTVIASDAPRSPRHRRRRDRPGRAAPSRAPMSWSARTDEPTARSFARIGCATTAAMASAHSCRDRLDDTRPRCIRPPCSRVDRRMPDTITGKPARLRFEHDIAGCVSAAWKHEAVSRGKGFGDRLTRQCSR